MIQKKVFDLFISITALIILCPVLLIFMVIVFLQDGFSPIYKAPRVGKDGKIFTMIKLRSMVKNADKNKVDSTSSDDLRITAVGKVIRKYKLDELMQLWNVLLGDMSLVGPRPNVERDVRIYSEEERKILSVKPGITDFSSIVFSDEGDILKGSIDPDLKYNQLIRPWKSRLCLLYIEKRNFTLDVKLIIYTAIAIVSRTIALKLINSELKHISADQKLIEVCRRETELSPFPPPGFDEVIQTREI